MSTEAQAFFAITGWDENTWDGKPHKDVTGAKLTHTVVGTTYTGDIQGTSKLQHLMSYVGDGTTGTFIALEQISGTLGGKKGTFVLRHEGTFDKTSVSGKLSIVPGSGTDELAGLNGTGAYELEGHRETYPLNLNYDFAS